MQTGTSGTSSNTNAKKKEDADKKREAADKKREDAAAKEAKKREDADKKREAAAAKEAKKREDADKKREAAAAEEAFKQARENNKGTVFEEYSLYKNLNEFKILTEQIKNLSPGGDNRPKDVTLETNDEVNEFFNKNLERIPKYKDQKKKSDFSQTIQIFKVTKEFSFKNVNFKNDDIIYAYDIKKKTKGKKFNKNFFENKEIEEIKRDLNSKLKDGHIKIFYASNPPLPPPTGAPPPPAGLDAASAAESPAASPAATDELFIVEEQIKATADQSFLKILKGKINTRFISEHLNVGQDQDILKAGIIFLIGEFDNSEDKYLITHIYTAIDGGSYYKFDNSYKKCEKKKSCLPVGIEELEINDSKEFRIFLNDDKTILGEGILKVIKEIVTKVEAYYKATGQQTEKTRIEIKLDDTTVVGVNSGDTATEEHQAEEQKEEGQATPPADDKKKAATDYDKSRGGSTTDLDAVIDQMHSEDNNLFFVRLTERVRPENEKFGLKMDYTKEGKNFIYNEASVDSALYKVINDNKIEIETGKDKIVSFIHKKGEKIYKYSVEDEKVTDITNLDNKPDMTSKWKELFDPKYNQSKFEKFFKTTFTTASPQSNDGEPTVDDENPLVIVFKKDTSSGQSGGGNLVEI